MTAGSHATMTISTACQHDARQVAAHPQQTTPPKASPILPLPFAATLPSASLTPPVSVQLLPARSHLSRTVPGYCWQRQWRYSPETRPPERPVVAEAPRPNRQGHNDAAVHQCHLQPKQSSRSCSSCTCCKLGHIRQQAISCHIHSPNVPSPG